MKAESNRFAGDAQFYRDATTGKYHSADPAKLPHVLVFAWDAASEALADNLCSLEIEFPAVIRLVKEADIDEAVSGLSSDRVVAFILFVSAAALQRESFGRVVSVCTGSVTLRNDFRLFVYPFGDLTFQKLREIAVRCSSPDNPVGALIESVHFPSTPTGGGYDNLVRLLRDYLFELPRHRNRLTFDGWQNRWNTIVKWIFYILVFQTIVSAGALTLFGTKLVRSEWFPWMVFGLGQLWFCSALALVSLPTRLASGFLHRCILVAAPFSLFKIFPWAVLAPHWPFLLAGFLTGTVTDIARRTLVQVRRRQAVVRLRHESDDPLVMQPPGKHYFHFLSNGPLFPLPVHVFISYSESSPWSAAAARNLHRELAELRVESFFAPDSIEPGSSWRHRLRDEIANCTTFVFLLDEVSAAKHWPEAELEAASLQQARSGLPAIAVLCRPGINLESLKHTASDNVRLVLESSSGADPVALRVIELSPVNKRSFAQAISKRYHWQAVSVIPVYLAAIVELPLLWISSLLSVIGVFGSFVVWPAIAAILWLKFHGTDPVAWLVQHHFLFASFVLAAYWLGFIARLAVGAWFELRYMKKREERRAGLAAGWRKLEVAVLIGICIILLPSTNALARVYAGIACAFGIILASFFMRKLLVGLSQASTTES